MSSSRSGLDRAIELADTALDRSPGSALVAGVSDPPARLEPVDHRYGALVGLSCRSSIDAVAGVHEATLATGDDHRHVILAVAVSRNGTSVARYRSVDESPTTLDRLTGPLVDIGLRALGLATPTCRRTPLDLLDASFADRVLGRLLSADLGVRPGWSEISASHPLAGGAPLPAAELRARRRRLAPIRWSEVRSSAAACSTIHDDDLSPSIARWLDDGSLARWLFARYPEPRQVFRDVCELLEPSVAGAFLATHGIGCDPAP